MIIIVNNTANMMLTLKRLLYKIQARTKPILDIELKTDHWVAIGLVAFTGRSLQCNLA